MIKMEHETPTVEMIEVEELTIKETLKQLK
jgi:hypothetical protein